MKTGHINTQYLSAFLLLLTTWSSTTLATDRRQSRRGQTAQGGHSYSEHPPRPPVYPAPAPTSLYPQAYPLHVHATPYGFTVGYQDPRFLQAAGVYTPPLEDASHAINPFEIIGAGESEETLITLFAENEKIYSSQLLAQDEQGNTPIHTAIQFGYPNFARILFDAIHEGFVYYSLIIKNKQGNTILFEALKTLARTDESLASPLVDFIEYMIATAKEYFPKTINFHSIDDADGIKPASEVKTIAKYFHEILSSRAYCSRLIKYFLSPTKSLDLVTASPQSINTSIHSRVLLKQELTVDHITHGLAATALTEAPRALATDSRDTTQQADATPTAVSTDITDSASDSSHVAGAGKGESCTTKKSTKKEHNRLKTQAEQKAAAERKAQKAEEARRAALAAAEAEGEKKRLELEKESTAKKEFLTQSSKACSGKSNEDLAKEVFEIIALTATPTKKLKRLEIFIAENPTAFTSEPETYFDDMGNTILVAALTTKGFDPGAIMLATNYPALIYQKNRAGKSTVEELLDMIVAAEEDDRDEPVLKSLLAEWYSIGLIKDDFALSDGVLFRNKATELRVIGGASGSATAERRLRHKPGTIEMLKAQKQATQVAAALEASLEKARKANEEALRAHDEAVAKKRDAIKAEHDAGLREFLTQLTNHRSAGGEASKDPLFEDTALGKKIRKSIAQGECTLLEEEYYDNHLLLLDKDAMPSNKFKYYLAFTVAAVHHQWRFLDQLFRLKITDVKTPLSQNGLTLLMDVVSPNLISNGLPHNSQDILKLANLIISHTSYTPEFINARFYNQTKTAYETALDKAVKNLNTSNPSMKGKYTDADGLPVVQFLVQQGATIQARTLNYACQFSSPRVLKFLLDSLAMLNPLEINVDDWKASHASNEVLMAALALV